MSSINNFERFAARVLLSTAIFMAVFYTVGLFGTGDDTRVHIFTGEGQ